MISRNLILFVRAVACIKCHPPLSLPHSLPRHTSEAFCALSFCILLWTLYQGFVPLYILDRVFVSCATVAPCRTGCNESVTSLPCLTCLWGCAGEPGVGQGELGYLGVAGMYVLEDWYIEETIRNSTLIWVSKRRVRNTRTSVFVNKKRKSIHGFIG